jgi:hypothetical protein
MKEQREMGVARARLDALQRFLEIVAPKPTGIASQLDAVAGEVLAAFGDASVDALLLKGRGLGTLLYGPGDHRSFSDVDLLVAPAKFDAAEDMLDKLGYAHGDVDIDDIGGVVHAHMWVRTGPGSTAEPPIDLHRRLPGSHADPAVAWEALAARRTWIEVGGRQAPVLDRVGQAMHLAIHAAQHGPTSEKHVSELEVALVVWPDVWEPAARLAAEIGATEAFAAGLRLARRGVGVAAVLGLPTTERLDWMIKHRGGRPRGTFHLQALVDARSPRAAFAVVRRSLLPRRAWIFHEHPWSRRGGWRLIAAYGVHLANAPAWAARAWSFRRRAQRARRLP